MELPQMPSMEKGSSAKLLPSPGDASFGSGKRIFVVMIGAVGIILLFSGGTYLVSRFSAIGGSKSQETLAPAGITTNTTQAAAQNEDAADQDSDGLTNAQELQYKTDPAKADSDADGYKDGEEVQHGFNPNGAGTLPSSGRF